MSARSVFSRGAVALALLIVAGCSRVENRPSPGPAPARGEEGVAGACTCGPAPIVDPTLLAFLSLARAAHHNADRAEDVKDWKAAVAALDPIAKSPIPGGDAHPAPEAAEVLADTHARRADFESALGDFDAALRDIDAGLALVKEPTYFRGHLFEIQGLVYEREAKVAKEKNDRAGVERANKLAAEASDKAVEIQFEVIGNALGGMDAGAPPPPKR